MIYQRKAGRRVAVVGCIVLLAACAERGGKVVGPDAPRSTRVQTDLSWLSRSIAVGMGEPEVRAAVRDAMRASRLTEHKLSLQQFMTTAEGSLLLRAAAAVQETSAQELSEAIARLPELDFYVPRREHRLTWRASRDYMVVATMNADPRKTGFDADGRSVVLDISLPETPGPAVLLLHPAETKSRRVAPQPDRAGLTIQDPDDGELSGTFVFTDAEGRITVVELADLLLHAQPSGLCWTIAILRPSTASIRQIQGAVPLPIRRISPTSKRMGSVIGPTAARGTNSSSLPNPGTDRPGTCG